MKKHLFLSCIAFTLATICPALGQSHAYLWDSTTGIRDLGTLGGDSFAYAVNDSGTVVGSYVPTDGRIYYHGFIWSEATGMVDIGVPGGGDSNTAEVFCTAINSAGNVVGYGRQVDGRQVAFFWSPTDGFTTLWHHSTNADNGNTAYAINDLDQVTGNLIVNKRGLIYHAYLWSPGMVDPRDLGVVEGAQYSLGLGINNLGKIVGGSYAAGDAWEPMSWTKKSGMNLIGMIPGTAYALAEAINDAGQVVGLDQTGTSDLGFYTAPGMGLKFLKGLGGNVTVAHAINQSGVIVGYAEDTTNTTHAVMWATPTSVPEVFSTAAGNALGINNLGQIVGQAYFPQ
jgi:probable HAF family extracellular repeat protein